MLVADTIGHLKAKSQKPKAIAFDAFDAFGALIQYGENGQIRTGLSWLTAPVITQSACHFSPQRTANDLCH